MPHFGVREDVRSVMDGIRQIGKRYGVLGADVAAAAAVAAARASRLRYAGRINGFPETHRYRCGRRLLVQCDACGRQCFELGAQTGIGIARWPEPAGCPRIALCDQPVLRDLGRPNLVAKDARIRPESHAGVDQRTTAEATADEDVHVLAETDVVEAGGRAHAQALAGDLHLLAQIREAAGKFAGQKFAAAFQNSHPLAGSCQTRGGNTCAIARPHHHHIVMALQAIERPCKTNHSQIPERAGP
jgi:hypothetical protein